MYDALLKLRLSALSTLLAGRYLAFPLCTRAGYSRLYSAREGPLRVHSRPDRLGDRGLSRARFRGFARESGITFIRLDDYPEKDRNRWWPTVDEIEWLTATETVDDPSGSWPSAHRPGRVPPLGDCERPVRGFHARAGRVCRFLSRLRQVRHLSGGAGPRRGRHHRADARTRS